MLNSSNHSLFPLAEFQEENLPSGDAWRNALSRFLFACIGLFALAAACTKTAPDTRDADIKVV
jgi:hypothetical protein